MINLVEKIIKEENSLSDDFDLTKAYVTFHCKLNHIEIPDKYREEISQLPNSVDTIFRQKSAVGFLLYATDTFADFNKASNILKTGDFNESIIGKAHVALKILMIKEAPLPSIISNEYTDYLESFKTYKKSAKEDGLDSFVVGKDIFIELKQAMLFEELSDSFKEIKATNTELTDNQALAVASYLSDNLKLAINERIQFVYSVCVGKKDNEIIKLFIEPKKKKIRGTEEKKKTTYEGYIKDAKECSRLIRKFTEKNFVTLVNILKAIEATKKKRQGQKDINYRDVNILEICTFLDDIRRFSFFYLKKYKMLIVDPSYSFLTACTSVKKAIYQKGFGSPPTFVVQTDWEAEVFGTRWTTCKFISFPKLISLEKEENEIIIIPGAGNLSNKTKYINFGNAAEAISYGRVKDLIKERFDHSPKNIVFSCDNDKSFEDADSIVYSFKENIRSLYLFPRGIEHAKNQSWRTMWFAAHSGANEVSVHNVYSIMSIEGTNIGLSVPSQIRSLEKSVIFNPGQSLRRNIRDTENVPDKNYDKLEFINFLNNMLMITYSVHRGSRNAQDEDKYAVNCSMQYVFPKEDKCKKKMLPLRPWVEKLGTVDNINEAIVYASKIYPYSIKKEEHSSSNEVSIRRQVKAALIELNPLTDVPRDHLVRVLSDKFKGYIYFNEEIEEPMSQREKDMLRILSTRTDLADSKLGEITIDSVVEAVSLFKEWPDNLKDQEMRLAIAFQVMNKVIRYALRDNVDGLNENVFDIQNMNHRRSERMYAHVRGLAVKTFTDAQFRKAYKILKRETLSGNPCSFGVLISLLTGLEANIVSALKWKDIQQIVISQTQKFYLLDIGVQVPNNEETPQAFYSPNDYRLIPVGRILTALLTEAREKIASNYDKDTYIVRSFGIPEDYKKIVFPKKMKETAKEIIRKKVGIEDNVIFIPKENGETKDTDLAKYCGDFLRENFRYQLDDKAKMNEDEIQYFLGNERATTLGCHYIDFKNKEVLIRLNTQLDRISAFLEESSDNTLCKASNGGRYIKSYRPTVLVATAELKENETVTIEASAPHGVKIIKGNVNAG